MIRVKETVRTKKGLQFAGKSGRYVGRTANNWIILEIDDANHYFVRKDLVESDISSIPELALKKVEISGFEELKEESETIDEIIEYIKDLSIRKGHSPTKITGLLCRRHKSKGSFSRQLRRSSNERRLSKNARSCRGDEETSLRTGRCVKKCPEGKIRNADTGRCKDIFTSGKDITTVVKKIDKKMFEQFMNNSRNKSNSHIRSNKSNKSNKSNNSNLFDNS